MLLRKASLVDEAGVVGNIVRVDNTQLARFWLIVLLEELQQLV
jgi:hypothetical protein